MPACLSIIINTYPAYIQFIRLIDMNMYYFGDSLEYIQAQYATSNRSTCRGCKEKIQKDTLRMGLILDDDHFNAKYWYHLKCFQLKPRHKQIQEDKIDQKIYNIDRLQAEDYDAVIEHIKSELDRIKNKKKGGKKEAKKEQKKETKKQTKKATKKKKVEDSDEQSQQSFSQSEQESSESQEQSNKKPKKKQAKKPSSKKIEVKVYTDQQLDQFSQLCEKYDAMNANELKQMLAKNRQSKNGTKPQLVEKCADGKILGQIPTCSACGGGRLRFDRLTGIYTCPGYMEDTDFVRCGKKFQFSQIKRGEWVQ